MQIQLERIWDKATANPDPRFAVVVQPPVHAEQVVHQLIEHLVVAELDVPAQIPCESVLVDDRLRKAASNVTGFQNEPVGDATLLESPRRAKARRACADDQVSYFHGWALRFVVGGEWLVWFENEVYVNTAADVSTRGATDQTQSTCTYPLRVARSAYSGERPASTENERAGSCKSRIAPAFQRHTAR